MKQKGKIIAIVGGIATGKSTLAKVLSSKLGARIFQEEFRCNPYLKEQYTKDQKSFESHIWFLNSRLQKYQEALKLKEKGETIILDTAVVITQDIFRQLYFKGIDTIVLKELTRNVIDPLPLPDLAIFLAGSNKFILKRLKKRGRKLESTLSEKVIKDINLLHSKVLKKYKGRMVRINIEKGDFKNKIIISQILDLIKI